MKMNSWVVITLYLLIMGSQTFCQWTPVDAPDSSIVQSFAAGGSSIVIATGKGIFHSTDNGVHWNAADTGLVNTNVQSLAVIGNTVFAGTGRGVYFSTGGENWTAINTGPADVSIKSLAVDGSTVYAGTEGNGVFISPDKGINWGAAGSGLAGYIIQFLAAGDNTIYVGTYSSCSACLPAFSMFSSRNSGISWEIDTSFSNNWASSLAVNGTSFFAGTYSHGVLRSTNGGVNWTEVNTGLLDTCIEALAVSNGNIYAGTYHGGIYMSTNNGGHWSSDCTGLPDTVVKLLALSSTDLFALTEGRGIWRRPISEMSALQRTGRYTTDGMHLRFSHGASNVILAFSISHPGKVSIDFYDLTGRKTASMFNRFFNVGTYEYMLDKHNIADGTYIVKVRTGGGTYSQVVQVGAKF